MNWNVIDRYIAPPSTDLSAKAAAALDWASCGKLMDFPKSFAAGLTYRNPAHT
ncbi:hypothetical protein HKX17_16275 [Sulfitobacter sp. KE34]|uniref:hypothetical protein n=1 Tax=unclassified Sulfitobacter TaxID=196795 RepID=UPI00144586FF|nr:MULTISPECIES: hypothetical protein [unclassified Sulfitobacter]NKX40233.1 hypothetical protein [Rhodobacteraceae bacterium R_SAG2]MDF3351706.1 hypothetical protein [Sulfitobacter sp. KE12]MDF3355378.1 hypothetical protein [Sulfitobacter sp. KE27]MDF3359026.1 hypothetical protein [Sulfitobacter sp. KE33]MDF3361267.1 hypothetical protein [Sulfitobacter sp. Ks41]